MWYYIILHTVCYGQAPAWLCFAVIIVELTNSLEEISETLEGFSWPYSSLLCILSWVQKAKCPTGKLQEALLMNPSWGYRLWQCIWGWNMYTWWSNGWGCSTWGIKWHTWYHRFGWYTELPQKPHVKFCHIPSRGKMWHFSTFPPLVTLEQLLSKSEVLNSVLNEPAQSISLFSSHYTSGSLFKSHPVFVNHRLCL